MKKMEFGRFVIQSEAKNLNTSTLCLQILRRYAPLNDKLGT